MFKMIELFLKWVGFKKILDPNSTDEYIEIVRPNRVSKFSSFLLDRMIYVPTKSFESSLQDFQKYLFENHQIYKENNYIYLTDISFKNEVLFQIIHPLQLKSVIPKLYSSKFGYALFIVFEIDTADGSSKYKKFKNSPNFKKFVREENYTFCSYAFATNSENELNLSIKSLLVDIFEFNKDEVLNFETSFQGLVRIGLRRNNSNL